MNKPAELCLPQAVARGLTIAYLLAAAWLLISGVYVRFHMPQAPIPDPDVRGYLGPAIHALLGHGFTHLDGRSFPYPLFVFIVLKAFGDFRAIAMAQHACGVIAGGVILLAWDSLLGLIPCSIPRQAGRLAGLAPAAIFLNSATALQFEQDLRPEALFPLLCILGIWLGLLFFKHRFVDQSRHATWIGGLLVFVTASTCLLKPSFGLAAVLATLPVWLSLVIPGTRNRVLLAALAIVPAVLLLFLPEALLKRPDAWSRQFLPETLFCVHAPQILDQLARDLASQESLPYPRDLLRQAHDLLRGDLQQAETVETSKSFDVLGFNPDYLMYDSFCLEFAAATQWTPDDLSRFYTAYYRRTLARQPMAIAKKVRAQLGLFYCGKNPAYRLGQALDMSRDFARAEQVVTGKIPAIAKYAPARAYFDECGKLGAAPTPFTQPRRLTEWTRSLSGNYMRMLWFALLSPLLLTWKPLRPRIGWLIAGVLFVFAYNFGNSLTVAIVHTLEVTRYVRIQLIFTLFAQWSASYLLLETLFSLILILRARRQGQPIADCAG